MKSKNQYIFKIFNSIFSSFLSFMHADFKILIGIVHIYSIRKRCSLN
jgi:hypothetical protein